MAVEAEELRTDLLVHSHSHSHSDRGRHELTKDLDELSTYTIRTPAIDVVEAARSSHPGTPIALAPLGDQLLARLMKHDPGDPAWSDRDRFVFSAGHASMVLYALQHLSGDDLPPGRPTRAVKAGRAFGWCGWADAMLWVARLGASAPAATGYESFGLTRDHVAARARTLLGR